MARPIAEAFGRAFRKAYEDAGITQAELAEALQQRGWVRVTQARVSAWARGMYVPPLDILPAVDEALGRPKGFVLWLAGYTDASGLAPYEREAAYEESEAKRVAAAAARGRAAEPASARGTTPRSA